MVNNKYIIEDLGIPVGEVFHYTKLENLSKIITPEGIIFHAGRYDAMNDPTDSEFLTNNINRLRCKSGLMDIIGEFGGDDICSFLVSFCREGDNPLMWRLYNAEVCLQLDSNAIYEHSKAKGCEHTHMSTVIYSEKIESDSNVFRKMQESLNLPKFMEQKEYEAQVYASFYKHPHFSVEKEWRIACFGKDPICSEVKTKDERYGVINFYREIWLPRECLKGIIIRSYDRDMKLVLSRQIEFWLKECGYPEGSINIQFTQTACVRN